jgi:hypothetical protein
LSQISCQLRWRFVFNDKSGVLLGSGEIRSHDSPSPGEEIPLPDPLQIIREFPLVDRSNQSCIQWIPVNVSTEMGEVILADYRLSLEGPLKRVPDLFNLELKAFT